jgi:hypothetical protein
MQRDEVHPRTGRPDIARELLSENRLRVYERVWA